MFLCIIILPLLSCLIATNRKNGMIYGPILSVLCMGVAAILSLIAFFEVGLSGSPVIESLGNWIDNGNILIEWSFIFDTLTVSMYLPIVIISFLIQIYSLEYMGSDPHKQRFFSILSLFAFTMQVLVTGENLFIILLGWEGIEECLKYFIPPVLKDRVHNLNKREVKIPSHQRIGPHNYDVISILFGSILGDGHIEKRSKKGGSRFKLIKSNSNVEYLKSFHSFFSERGYCNTKKPKLIKRPVGFRKKPGYEYNINTYTFLSFNWLHKKFYTEQGKKIKPSLAELNLYFSPLALAHLFKSDGSKVKNAGAIIALNNFTKKEVNEFSIFLNRKYNLKTSVQAHTVDNPKKGYIVYIYKESLPLLSHLIKKYKVPSKYYKLNE